MVYALIIGFVGAHKFYVGRKWWGLAYIALCWSGITAVASLIEAAVALSLDDEQFDKIHNPQLQDKSGDLDKLAKLHALKESGELTPEEYYKEKSKICSVR